MLIGRYLKTWSTYAGADWENFKEGLLEEFKEDDEEQKSNTEAYLQCLVQELRKEKNPSASKCRAFIFEFTELADQLVKKAMINQHIRAFLFLPAFSDKIGDKFCKRCKIDIEDPLITIGVWNNLKKEALKVSTKDDSQISRLWQSKKVEESRLPPPVRPERRERPVVLERSTDSRIPEHIIDRGKPEDLDTGTQLMKELRLRQVEAQKRLDEQMLFMRDVFTKAVAAIPQPVYVAPNQYQNL